MFNKRKLSEGITAKYDGTFVTLKSDLGHFIQLPHEALDNLVLLRREINERDRNEELAKEDGRTIEPPYEIPDEVFESDFRHAMRLADEAIERTPIGEAIRFEEVQEME